ncbi:MAG: MmgE/PrpD family protein [Myxococcota bacterium]
MSETPAPVTEALARYGRALSYETIPEAARDVARHCVLDFLGCALAGAREELSEIVVREVATPEASAQATLIGRSARATAATAALFNGAAGHALDYDDTAAAMGGHPSVAVLPAVFAAAEVTGASGRDFLTALVAGFEVQARIGRLLGGGHYAAGFHNTGTVGTFGAAAACAHLFGLDETGWRHALGLAGTQAAGLKSGFGTMAKPLHAGRAASAGFVAASLARGGFTANPSILEVPQGFHATHAGQTPTLEALAAETDRFHTPDTLFKYHAACYLTHSTIETIGRFRAEAGLDPEKIEAIEVRVHPGLFGVCHIPEPTTGLEGKFSLRVTAALAALGRATEAPETFCEATMSDPVVVAMRDRVTVIGDESTPAATHAHVSVRHASGVLEEAFDSGRPERDLARQGERLSAKFERLSVPAIGEAASGALRDGVRSLEGQARTADLLTTTTPSH